nr:hypothetical protein [Tanacetum cinerariifolium]
MDMTTDQQVTLDEALVPYASQLKIRKSNFSLRSDITSKELTVQVVYDVLRLTPFYKAFLVTADVPKIYTQELWATATVYHHSICFKMNNKKQEILAFLRYLGHRGKIKNINDDTTVSGYLKLKFFVACTIRRMWTLTIFYGRNLYIKLSIKMPRKAMRCTTPDSQRDDQMFTTIKLIFRHQNTQQFGAMLPVELTNEDIRNSAAYKEYYAIASRASPPKIKARKQPAKSSKAKGLYVLSEVALTKAEQMKLATKRSLKQTHISQASGSGADEGTGIIPSVPDVPTYESDKEISSKSSDEDDDNDVDDQNSDNDGDDFVHPKLSTHDKEAKDEESFDPIVQTSSQGENSYDESNDDESHGMNVGGDEGSNAEDDDKELYRDVNINLEGIDSLFGSTPWVNVLVMTTVEPLLLTATTLPPPSIPTISQVQQAPAPSPITAPSTFLQIILDTYRDTIMLKRRRDNEDNDEESSAGSDRGSKRRRAGKEPESTSAPKEKASKTSGNSTEGSKSHQKTTSVKSYQKKLNLIKPDSYRSDLKRKEAYTAFSNPRGFIYHNKDKQNRLLRIDELHKFSDDTLNDVRTALDDHLKGIRMKYLPQTIWRRSEKEK